MNGARKLLATIAGAVLLGPISAASGIAQEAPKDTPGWLNIGVPENLTEGAVSAPLADEDDRSLFSPTIDIGRFSVRGGRINPSFGLAWDRTTGLYGTTMGPDFDSADPLALSTGLTFNPPGWGSHSLIGQTVVQEPSRRNAFSIHGLGALERPGSIETVDPSSSFNLVLEGGNFPILPDLTYRFALINPSTGTGAAGTGTGFAAGLSTRLDLGQGIVVSPAIEAARLSESSGARERERQYLSTSMFTEWRNWNLGLSYTQRETGEADAPGVSEYQAQASVGYVFDFGLSADLGWYRVREEKESSDQFGFRFTYPFKIDK